MIDINFNDDRARPFVSALEVYSLQPKIDRLHTDLEGGLGKGSDFLGWLHFPSQTSSALLN